MGASKDDSGNNGGAAGGTDRSTPDRPPNDKRSDVNNPNNDAFDADRENRRTQKERGW